MENGFMEYIKMDQQDLGFDLLKTILTANGFGFYLNIFNCKNEKYHKRNL